MAKGDQRAFALLIEKYGASVYTHILSYVKNAARAEELSQDVFMSIWNHRENLPSIQNFQAYLIVLTRNRTISALRERIKKYDETAKDELESNTSDPEMQLEYRQLSESLQRGIEKLPARRREIFEMSRFEGKTYDEIAQQLNISKSAVNKHIIHALVFLRNFLHDEIGYTLLIVYLLTEF